ncbi:MAG: hypothetical protein WKF86_03265, partial [Acidimicrobiales bacterium]
SLLVFENVAWAPARAQLPADAAAAAREGRDPASVDLSGAEAVLAPTKPGSSRFRGDVDAGEVLVAEAPSSRWQLKVDGESADRHPAFGVMSFTVASPGPATLRFQTPLAHRLAVLLQALLWLAALGIVAAGAMGITLRARSAPGPRPLGPPVDDTPNPDRPGVVLLDPVGTDPGNGRGSS